MDTNQRTLTDALGVHIGIGDTVATAMVSRSAGPGLNYGAIVAVGTGSVSIKTQYGRTIRRAAQYVVKTAGRAY